MWFPADVMKKSFVWIPIVAAPVFLQAEELKGVDEQAKCSAQEAPLEVKFTTGAELEAVALEQLLKNHGGAMSDIEKSTLSSVIGRLEEQANQSQGVKNKDLGVSVAPLDEATRRLIQPEIKGGLRVTEADHDGVLSFWGVGPHDLIVATNGQPIHNAQALQDVLDGAVKENKPVLLDVIAKGNRRTINLLPLRDRARLKKGAPRFWQFRGC